MFKLLLTSLLGTFHNLHRPKKSSDHEADFVLGPKLKRPEDLEWWLKAKRGVVSSRQVFIA